MTKPATDLPLTPRERLRWRRAMDSLLIDSIYGRVVRDPSLAHSPQTTDDAFAATVGLVVGAQTGRTITIG